MFLEDGCVRALGKIHDVTHLRQSSFYNKLIKQKKLKNHVFTIGRQQISPYVKDYSAYHILTWI